MGRPKNQKKFTYNSQLQKWRRGDQGKAIQQNNEPTGDLWIFRFIPTRSSSFSTISFLTDSERLLLSPWLLPFPNHRFIFLWVFKSSGDERLRLISRFAGWRLPCTCTPQVSSQGREKAGGLHFLCFFYCCYSPSPSLHSWEEFLLEYFLIYIVRNLCWCAWVGKSCFIFFLFLFLKALCLNFLHSLPFRFTVEKLNYKKYNKYLLNWWRQ